MLTKVVKKKIGKETHSFMVEGENFMDVMIQAQKLSFPDIHKCGLCGSDNLVLGYHKAQDKFDYITIGCRSCRAQLNFGESTQVKGTYYLRSKKNDQGGIMKDDKGFVVYDWTSFDNK